MITKLLPINDFRNTSYKNNDFSLKEKKKNFMGKFSLAHPHVTNVYNTIKNRSNKFNLKFRAIYYEKCIYCGISTQVIDSSRFEIDHVIPTSAMKFRPDYFSKDINGINNLVSSCQMCNRGKGDFFCDDKALEILHPDNNNLPLVFERSNDYSIKVTKKYQENPVILEFYNKLKFDNQLRRLDYFLMEMKDFCVKYEGDAIVNEIEGLILKIESKRRRSY